VPKDLFNSLECQGEGGGIAFCEEMGVEDIGYEPIQTATWTSGGAWASRIPVRLLNKKRMDRFGRRARTDPSPTVNVHCRWVRERP